MAEGDKIVQELLESGAGVKTVFATRDWLLDNRELAEKSAGVEILEVTPEVLRQLSSLSAPNRALALADIPPARDFAPEGVSLALETIQDPGNLGTIIRIADWFGIRQVVCSPDCVDAYNAKTIQATMGSFQRVTIIIRDIPSSWKTRSYPPTPPPSKATISPSLKKSPQASFSSAMNPVASAKPPSAIAATILPSRASARPNR